MQRLIFAPPDAQHAERRLTAAFTGIRWGELIALRLSLVFVRVRGGTPKRGSWRTTVKWTKRVTEAGLPAGFTSHDLRHTGNQLAVSDASTRELMQRVGHSTMRAALINQHANERASSGDL
ncbi:hypothetical protein ABZX12_03420 [Kribbella sp. NPDC003505]|uniref:hypothetical protein n=1 Tax=Kribbella sp. NPDC003505 TaxID=3154448 RepID=UPI0033A0BF3B